MRFQVLGPLHVWGRGDRSLEITSPKHRALLSLLLLEASRVVSVDRIVDQLWGDRPPASATATLQTYVSQLRRLLEPGRGPREAPRLLVTRAPGYALLAEDDVIDAHRLPRLVAHGTRLAEAGELDSALAVLDEAADLWRGEPYADLDATPAVAAERQRLAELVLAAHEQAAGLRIHLGRADVAVAELELLVAAHPLRERLWARLMEGLWATGRQADALTAYRRCARLLREELGIEPGPELARVHEAVLRQELSPAPPPGPPPSAGAINDRAALAPAPPEPARPAGQGAKEAGRAAYGTVLSAADRSAAGSDPDSEVDGPRDLRPGDHDRKPIVGRDAERDLIRSALVGTTRGAGGVLVLEGEAGIGKTRLAEEATAMAEAQGWSCAWARCADDAGAPALWPWSRLLEQLGLGGLRLGTDDDPDRSRFALFQDVRARLQEVSTRVPLLIVLDDLQAADETSLQLLTLFARHLDGVRVLVVVTVRTVGDAPSGPVQECLARLASARHTVRLSLGGLAEEGVRELLEMTLGSGGGDLVRRIHARTEGNPFFVREFAQLLRTGPGLDPAASAPVPPSVREVLEQRLATLPADTLDVLRMAAVAGQEVELPLLQAACDREAGQVVDALEPALRAGVVVERQPGWEWRFNHALMQETLLAGMSRLETARRHRRIGEAWEARGQLRAIDVGRLAHHFLHAVPVSGATPAIRYASLAAEAARERLAHPEAAEHTRTALRLLDLQPADTGPQRHRLLVSLATDLLRSGLPIEAQEIVGQALDLARRLDDGQLVAEAAAVWGHVTLWNWRPYGVVDHDLVSLIESLLDDALDEPLRARLLGTLAVELAYSDRRDEGIDLAERAVGIARAQGDPILLGRVLNNLSIAAWGVPDGVERRMTAADESLSLVGRGLPARTEFLARLHRGPLRLHLGDGAGFEADLAAARRIAATLSGPEVRPHVLYQEAGLAMLRGKWESVEPLAREAFDLFVQTSSWGAAEMCWGLHQFTIRRRQGRVAESLPALIDLGDTGIPLAQAVAVVAAAEAGDPQEARRLRRRWPHQHPVDWTTDALAVTRAWAALLLGEDVGSTYEELLPYRGRQVVVGTATAVWGSYDLVLADLAAALGKDTAALHHAREALALAIELRSPWQEEDARQRLTTLAGLGDVTASA
ncbi:BTAD domain-containing putative transcriptional regulator [Intrasporangium sp.]|uniref:BTAD domain-containing putative transcriptional regulator n=1 Tax=Intrasporangium sp. TaxID=1925024 RepID=UPI0029398F53|nr:BTAD domain-containing putative transcriptional regulator [Intrasporangium sp.]MDV3222490.1 AAA family ATPase [Intrasporangium sp.]